MSNPNSAPNFNHLYSFLPSLSFCCSEKLKDLVALQFLFLKLLHKPIHSSVESNIAGGEIELKYTIFLNEWRKSYLLPIILDSSLLLKSKFFKVFKEQSWRKLFVFDMARLPRAIFLRTTRFSLKNNKSNTKQAIITSHFAGTFTGIGKKAFQGL